MSAKRVVGFVTIMLLSLILTQVAIAGPKGRRNTAAILGGLTVYHALKGHDNEALTFGLATIVANERYRDSREQDYSYGRHRPRPHPYSYGGGYDSYYRQPSYYYPSSYDYTPRYYAPCYEPRYRRVDESYYGPRRSLLERYEERPIIIIIEAAPANNRYYGR
ncbi:MAG TPA: hypothetical protein VJJ80_00965 [Patescibacteria group bacterium]|nr:hypothetical protein [Patescibacteria group bacterium]